MRPLLVGITGGIATGKSTLSRMIQEEGYTVIFSDQIGHEVLLLPEIKLKLVNEFGSEILTGNRIDREKLREKAFNNKEKLEKLNQIVHPGILEAMDDLVIHSPLDYIFIEIPLLFETQLDECLDFIVLIYVDQETQIQRLIGRNNFTLEHAKRIIDSQMSLDKKIQRADLAIENNGTEDDLHCQVWKIIKHLPVIKKKKIKSFLKTKDHES